MIFFGHLSSLKTDNSMQPLPTENSGEFNSLQPLVAQKSTPDWEKHLLWRSTSLVPRRKDLVQVQWAVLGWSCNVATYVCAATFHQLIVNWEPQALNGCVSLATVQDLQTFIVERKQLQNVVFPLMLYWTTYYRTCQSPGPLCTNNSSKLSLMILVVFDTYTSISTEWDQ